MGWIADYPSIDNFIYLFTTEGGKYGSYSCYSNPQVDKLFKQARSTVDETQRLNLYNEAQKLILADAPVRPGLHVPGRPRDQQPHRWLQLQLVRLGQHVERVGQVGLHGRLPRTGRLSRLHAVIHARRSAAAPRTVSRRKNGRARPRPKGYRTE